MRKIVLFIVGIVLTFTTTAKKKDLKAITNVLAVQAAEWNKGNVAAYMKGGYWENDSLLFIGSKGPVYGYEPTLKNYLRSYPDAAHTGHLTLTLLNSKRLSAKYYFVVGKWQLERSAGNVGGYFTLLFKKVKRHWVIIADHSS